MFVGGHHTSEFNLDLQTGLWPNQNTVKCKDVRLLHSAEDGFLLEGQWCVLSEPPRKSEPCSEFAQASLFRRGWCKASAAAPSSIWFFDSWSWLLNHIFFSQQDLAAAVENVSVQGCVIICVKRFYVSLEEDTILHINTQVSQPSWKDLTLYSNLFSFITAFQVNWHQCSTSR